METALLRERMKEKRKKKCIEMDWMDECKRVMIQG